jgi:DNA-binding LacI/PurR family transcriptional regulator
MADVAVVAGVSHQTVSRVLNGHPSVRPGTRERVLEAIAALGYRRNSAARALVTARSATIGVVTTGSPLFGPASTLIAVEEAAREAGYFVSVASTQAYDAETMRRVLEHFMAQAVEGVVVIAPHVAVQAALAQFRAPVPVVLIATEAHGSDLRGDPGVLSAAVDQRAGARAVTEHLLGAGHRSVLHLAGPPDWFDARERRRGWAEASVAHGDAELTWVQASWSAADGYRIGRALARGGPQWDGLVQRGGGAPGVGPAPRPTAVFAANDQLALGLLRGLWEEGVRVPESVSVAGFDDVEGSGYFVPPLTTVRQPFDVLGRRCIDLLVAAIRGVEVEPVVIAPELVVRESTGPGPVLRRE